MELWTFVYAFHSGLRWIVLAAALAALVYAIFGLVTRRPYDRAASITMTIFVRAVEIQWILGVILMIMMGLALGEIAGYQWGHLIMMTIAVVLAHVYMAFRKRPDHMRYVGAIVAIAATVVAIIVGVAALPGERWNFAPSIMPSSQTETSEPGSALNIAYAPELTGSQLE